MHNQKNKILTLMLGFTLLGGMTNTALAMQKKKTTLSQPEQKAIIAQTNLKSVILKQRFPKEYEDEALKYLSNVMDARFDQLSVLTKNLDNLRVGLELGLGSAKNAAFKAKQGPLYNTFIQFKTKMIELNKAYSKNTAQKVKPAAQKVKPVVQKIKQEHSKITWGVSERQGMRPNMEDAYCARDIHTITKQLKLPSNSLHKTIAPNENYQMYGIFDGHGGAKAAEIASRYLPDFYAKTEANSVDMILKEAFKATHKRIVGETTSGTTAVVALVRGEKLYVAWAGDARAVLEKNGKVAYSTQDHKPGNPKEKAAIEARGGFVVNMGGVHRVVGQLAVARALGDKDIAQYITAEPEIKALELTPANNFLILACDGVWDVLSNEEAVAIVKNSFAKQNQNAIKAKRILPQEQITENGNNISAQLAARALIDAAYAKGSSDNISALVVNFNWGNKIAPKKK